MSKIPLQKFPLSYLINFKRIADDSLRRNQSLALLLLRRSQILFYGTRRFHLKVVIFLHPENDKNHFFTHNSWYFDWMEKESQDISNWSIQIYQYQYIQLLDIFSQICLKVYDFIERAGKVKKYVIMSLEIYIINIWTTEGPHLSIFCRVMLQSVMYTILALSLLYLKSIIIISLQALENYTG